MAKKTIIVEGEGSKWVAKFVEPINEFISYTDIKLILRAIDVGFRMHIRDQRMVRRLPKEVVKTGQLSK